MTGGGKILAGFLVSGFLLALLGAALPAWGYHRDPPDFIAVGAYFLSVAMGVILSGTLAPPLRARRGLTFLLVFACSLSCAALAYLAVVTPPITAWWRIPGLLALGTGAGLLNRALLDAIAPAYRLDPAGTVNRGGIYYGLGCLAATLLVAGTFYVYTVPSIFVFMAVVPGVFGVLYARGGAIHLPADARSAAGPAAGEVRPPGTVWFAVLLFIQFGNEWSIAGWLPLFLIRRVGLSPSAALWTLALYWSCLLVGRVGAVAILPRVRQGRLLGGSALSALFGCLILVLTDNAFGAATGACLVGAGFASIYPLVAEKMGHRFPYDHPGHLSGIFSLAVVGGMLAPATLGLAAEELGVGVVMAIPLVGTCLVAALLLLIWLESKVTGR